ncbi:hypothetical protein KY285_023676 [Solanum tuberosum]|nr:hypothetical protein KY285_023676 [Solanum tuberosum]
MVVYEPLVRLFYANLRSPKAGELKSLVLGKPLENLDAMHAKLDAMFITVSQVSDVIAKLTAMETDANVAKICLRLDQIVKEAIKIAIKVQAGSKAISSSLSSRFEEMSTAIVNTLTYFLKPR